MDEIERYQQMNVLPSPRIGWETKQAYHDRLIEAHSDGLLTDDEYEARMTWVSNAQTTDQVLLAFKDLPLLRVTGVELTPSTLHTPQPRNQGKDKHPFVFLSICMELSFAGFFLAQGDTVMTCYYLALALVTTAAVYIKGR
jgi:hypothetical protein